MTPPPSRRKKSTMCSGRTMSESPMMSRVGAAIAPDCLIWHILRVAIHLLGKERREVLRVGRESEVLVVAGGFVHCSPSAPMTGTCCKSSAVASSP
jgi:hypothetical protein